MSAATVDSRALNEEGSEREPLLPKTSSLNDELRAGRRDVQPGSTDDFEEGLPTDSKPEPVKWTAWNVAFYVLMAAFGVFLLVIIIKGFVDAKDPNDVDVGYISSSSFC
jgi:hypothetical protein